MTEIIILGKTKEEIRAQFNVLGEVYDTITFKTVSTNGNKSVVRFAYHFETRSRKANQFITKWCTYWLIFNGNVCTGRISNKAAAIKYIGADTVKQTATTRKTDSEALSVFHKTMQEKFPEDKGNCVLLAVTNVTKLPYSTVREAAIRHGYNPRSGGMYRSNTYAMLDELGVKYEDCTTEIRSKARTLRTLDRRNINGIYLIHVKGHCTSMINGTVLDNNWNSTKPIYQVSRILI